MPFVKIKGATRNFTKPRTWDESQDGSCGDLWVREDTYGRYAQKNFAYRPSQEELAKLNAGGVIEVHIVSDMMPPVGVSVVTETDEIKS
jgi:hypothetical protein